MNRDTTYVLQILEAIEKIEKYTKGGKREFHNDVMIQDAVIRNIEIIGEVTKRISMSFRDDYPDVPWRQMAGIRDVLIHDYDSIDVAIVWNVVANELPKIKDILSEIE